VQEGSYLSIIEMKNEKQIWNEIESLVKEYNDLKLSELIDYRKFYLYSIISHSTAIEGSTLTETETLILFDEGLTAKGKPLLHHLMNEDLKNAYNFAFEEALKRSPMTSEFLNRLSSLVMKSTGSVYNGISSQWDSSKGDYRLHGVTAGFGGKSYVNFKKVPELVEQLCDELNVRILQVSTLHEIYTLSFDAHLNLATIHPWGDGNGRMARLLMNYIQFYFQQIPSKIFREDKAEYILSLRTSQDSDNPEPFRSFMLDQVLKMLKEEISNFKLAQKKGFSFMF
jgi:Fic family protein